MQRASRTASEQRHNILIPDVNLRYMKERTGAPPLLPMLRSEGQARVMTAVFVSATAPLSIAEIAKAADVTQRVALIEVDRLVGAALVTDERRGRARLITPNAANPAVAPLTALLEVTFGPEPLIRAALSDIADIEAAYIYGSWAERRAGAPGHAPDDIDVLVVGTADEDELEAAVHPLAQRLHRSVSVRRIRPERWRDGSPTGFVATVRSKPLITLLGPLMPGAGSGGGRA